MRTRCYIYVIGPENGDEMSSIFEQCFDVEVENEIYAVIGEVSMTGLYSDASGRKWVVVAYKGSMCCFDGDISTSFTPETFRNLCWDKCKDQTEFYRGTVPDIYLNLENPALNAIEYQERKGVLKIMDAQRRDNQVR